MTADDRAHRRAAHLHALVREHPEFDVLAEPVASTYALRYLPNAWLERQHEANVAERTDTLNARLAELLVAAVQGIRISMTRIESRVAVSLELGAIGHEEPDVDALFDVVAQTGRRLARQLSQEVSC